MKSVEAILQKLPMPPIYWMGRFLSRWFGLLYCRARVFGLSNVPRTGPVLLVCNHQSYLDPVMAGMPLPRQASYMARDSLFKNPFFGWLIYSVNAYPVRRGEADLSAIKETLRRLKDGHAVVIFPEGTRSQDGRIGPMLPGSAAIAKKAQVPLVPTLLDGLYEAWPKGQPFPSPARVVVEYGPALMPEEYADWSSERLMKELRDRLIAMQVRRHGLRSGGELKYTSRSPEPGVIEQNDTRLAQSA